MAETDRDSSSAVRPESAELLFDVPVLVSVELGRRRMTFTELMALRPGEVIKFAKAAGEPLDVLAGGLLVAHGEAVVVGDKFGVRITEVVVRSAVAVPDEHSV